VTYFARVEILHRKPVSARTCYVARVFVAEKNYAKKRIFAHFFEYFQMFSNVFEYFQTFSNVFERFFLAYFTQTLQPNTPTPDFDSKTTIAPKITPNFPQKTHFLKNLRQKKSGND
jgi:hypothetical protein